MNIRSATLSGMLGAVLAAGSALAQSYSVTGVSEGDTLSMRRDIPQVRTFGDAPVVGRIPPSATGVASTGLTVELEGSTWREVRHEGRTGWVNARYLDLAAYPDVPASLSCNGTEPFWSLSMDAEEGVLDAMADPAETLRVTGLRPGLGRRNLWAWYFRTAAGSSQKVAVVTYTQACSDGMSDLTYDYEVFLLGLLEGPVQGCCTIPLTE